MLAEDLRRKTRVELMLATREEAYRAWTLSAGQGIEARSAKGMGEILNLRYA